MEGEWNVQQGNRIKYQYNGIEHLDDICLSFSTFRVHDPALGRWLQVDPKAEYLYGHSPYNSMLNNPISYNDPNGDIIPVVAAAIVGSIVGAGANIYTQYKNGNLNSFGDWVGAGVIGGVAGGVGAVAGTAGAGIGAGVGILGNGITNSINGDPFFQGAGQAALYGAVGGALQIAGGGSILQAAVSVASSYLPSYNVNLGGGVGLSISPSILYGSGAAMIGLNIGLTYSKNNFTIGLSLGVSHGTNSFTKAKGFEFRSSAYGGYNNGSWGVGVSSNYFATSNTTQRTGRLHGNVGQFSFSYENDGTPFQYAGFGDGQDRYRTASITLGWGDLSIGTQIHTGERIYTAEDNIRPLENYPFGRVPNPQISNYLSAYLFVSCKGYRAGVNDWRVGHNIQNKFAHTVQPQEWIPWSENKFSSSLFQYSRGNNYTNW